MKTSKTNLLLSLVLLMGVISACTDNPESQKNEIAKILDLNEGFIVYLHNNMLDSQVPMIIDSEGNNFFAAQVYCNIDSDCINWWPGEGSCFNRKYAKYDEYYKEMKEYILSQGVNLVDLNSCSCYKHRCYFNEDPYPWMRENIPKSSHIFSWWDYGKHLEALGFSPIFKNPSESTTQFNALCGLEDEYICNRSKKELESEDRIEDASEFFITTNPTKSICIAHKYKADYVFFPTEMVSLFNAISMDNKLAKGYDYATAVNWAKIYGKGSPDPWEPIGVSENQSTFSRLLQHEAAGTNFELIYLVGNATPENHYKGGYMLFKINYPEDIDNLCASIA